MLISVLIQPPHRREAFHNKQIIHRASYSESIVKEPGLMKLNQFPASLSLRGESISWIILGNGGVAYHPTRVSHKSTFVIMQGNRHAIFSRTTCAESQAEMRDRFWRESSSEQIRVLRIQVF